MEKKKISKNINQFKLSYTLQATSVTVTNCKNELFPQ